MSVSKLTYSEAFSGLGELDHGYSRSFHFGKLQGAGFGLRAPTDLYAICDTPGHTLLLQYKCSACQPFCLTNIPAFSRDPSRIFRRAGTFLARRFPRRLPSHVRFYASNNRSEEHTSEL